MVKKGLIVASIDKKQMVFLGRALWNAVCDVYKLLWQTIGIPVIIFLLVSHIVTQYIPVTLQPVWQGFLWAGRIAFLLFAYLTVRSSIKRKTWPYYVEFLPLALYMALPLIVIFSVLSVTGYWWWSFISPIVAWMAFYFFDSSCTRSGGISVKSCLLELAHTLKKAFLLAIKHPVAYALLVLGLIVIWTLYMVPFQLLDKFVMPISIGDISFLLMPAEACLMYIIYTLWIAEKPLGKT